MSVGAVKLRSASRVNLRKLAISLPSLDSRIQFSIGMQFFVSTHECTILDPAAAAAAGMRNILIFTIF